MLLDDVRPLFPVAERIVYFNHAAVAPLATPTRDAMAAAVSEMHQMGATGWASWGAKLNAVRRSAARLVGAEAGEMAFVHNTSAGLAIAAAGLDWKRGDRVVAFACEFPANLYPWLALRRQGVEVTLLPESALLDLDEVRSACRGARLLSVSFVQYLSGFRAPIEAIGAICRETGTWFVVDAIQGLGALPMNVKRCGIHLLSADSHKWLTGPEGAGFAYVSEALLAEVTPFEVGWTSVENWESFEAAPAGARETELPRWRAGAARFECGALNFAGLMGMGAAITLLQSVGVENIAERVLGLNRQLTEGLRARGCTVLRPSEARAACSGIVSFRHARRDAAAVTAALEARAISCASRQGWVRLSPHLYNTLEEADRVLRTLDQVTA